MPAARLSKNLINHKHVPVQSLALTPTFSFGQVGHTEPRHGKLLWLDITSLGFYATRSRSIVVTYIARINHVLTRPGGNYTGFKERGKEGERANKRRECLSSTPGLGNLEI